MTADTMMNRPTETMMIFSMQRETPAEELSGTGKQQNRLVHNNSDKIMIKIIKKSFTLTLILLYPAKIFNSFGVLFGADLVAMVTGDRAVLQVDLH